MNQTQKKLNDDLEKVFKKYNVKAPVVAGIYEKDIFAIIGMKGQDVLEYGCSLFLIGHLQKVAEDFQKQFHKTEIQNSINTKL